MHSEEVSQLALKWLFVFEASWRPDFFSDVLDHSIERQFECLRAHVHAGLTGGEIYVIEIEDKGIIGGVVWFGPGQCFLARYVYASLPSAGSAKSLR